MPQKLFIPYIGSVVILTEDWDFNLYFEYRNDPLIKALWTGTPPPKPAKNYDKNDWPARSAYWDLERKFKGAGTTPEEWKEDKRLRVEKALSDDDLEKAASTFKATRGRDKHYIAATLPANTPLRIDRVYIRKGVDAFSSITFVVAKECKDKKLRGKRFWARLRDVNNIICEPI
mgnify:CR=1 FL=1